MKIRINVISKRNVLTLILVALIAAGCATIFMTNTSADGVVEHTYHGYDVSYASTLDVSDGNEKSIPIVVKKDGDVVGSYTIKATFDTSDKSWTMAGEGKGIELTSTSTVVVIPDIYDKDQQKYVLKELPTKIFGTETKNNAPGLEELIVASSSENITYSGTLPFYYLMDLERIVIDPMIKQTIEKFMINGCNNLKTMEIHVGTIDKKELISSGMGQDLTVILKVGEEADLSKGLRAIVQPKQVVHTTIIFTKDSNRPTNLKINDAKCEETVYLHLESPYYASYKKDSKLASATLSGVAKEVKTYTTLGGKITLTTSTGGEVKLDKVKARVGEKISVEIIPNNGYLVDKKCYKIGDVEADIGDKNSFRMPLADVAVHVTFIPNVVYDKYTATIEDWNISQVSGQPDGDYVAIKYKITHLNEGYDCTIKYTLNDNKADVGKLVGAPTSAQNPSGEAMIITESPVVIIPPKVVYAEKTYNLQYITTKAFGNSGNNNVNKILIGSDKEQVDVFFCQNCFFNLSALTELVVKGKAGGYGTTISSCESISKIWIETIGVFNGSNFTSGNFNSEEIVLYGKTDNNSILGNLTQANGPKIILRLTHDSVKMNQLKLYLGEVQVYSGGGLWKEGVTTKDIATNDYSKVQVVCYSKASVATTIAGGTIALSVEETIVSGQNVVVTVAPDEGKTLSRLYYVFGETEVDISGTQFEMPAGDIIVNAVFIDAPASDLIVVHKLTSKGNKAILDLTVTKMQGATSEPKKIEVIFEFGGATESTPSSFSDMESTINCSTEPFEAKISSSFPDQKHPVSCLIRLFASDGTVLYQEKVAVTEA